MAKKQPPRYRLRIVDWSALDGDQKERSWYFEMTADANGRASGPGWQCLMWHQGPKWLADQVAAWCREKGAEVIEQKPGTIAEGEALVPDGPEVIEEESGHERSDDEGRPAAGGLRDRGTDGPRKAGRPAQRRGKVRRQDGAA